MAWLVSGWVGVQVYLCKSPELHHIWNLALYPAKNTETWITTTKCTWLATTVMDCRYTQLSKCRLLIVSIFPQRTFGPALELSHLTLRFVPSQGYMSVLAVPTYTCGCHWNIGMSNSSHARENTLPETKAISALWRFFINLPGAFRCLKLPHEVLWR